MLFISSLMFGFLEQFFVFMLAHLFFTPFYNITHKLTSFISSLCSLINSLQIVFTNSVHYRHAGGLNPASSDFYKQKTGFRLNTLPE